MPNINCILSGEDLYDLYLEEKEVVKDYFYEKVWRDKTNRLEFSIRDGLYHSNSVSTSISFIKNRKFYSRQYGEDYFPNEQTAQWSDEIDKDYGIYNDIFLNNCDLRVSNNAQDVYGPVTFVFSDRLLLEPGLKFRISKNNPAVDKSNWREIPNNEKYFESVEELREYIKSLKYTYRSSFNINTIIYNQDYIPLDRRYLKYIFVERNKNIDISFTISGIIQRALKKAGLNNIPVIIRKDIVPLKNKTANDINELWRYSKLSQKNNEE